MSEGIVQLGIVRRTEEFHGSSCLFCLSSDVFIAGEQSGNGSLYWAECASCHCRGPIKTTIDDAEKAFSPCEPERGEVGG